MTANPNFSPKFQDFGSDAIWVRSLDLRGLQDLGGLTELDGQPVPRYHPHCITTRLFKHYQRYYQHEHNTVNTKRGSR